MATQPTTVSTIEQGSIARDLADEFRRLFGVQIIKLNDPLTADDGLALVAPHGVAVHSVKKFIDEFRERPERRGGTSHVGELESFIAHAKRHAGANSVLFADPSKTAPTLTAIYDYHDAGAENPEDDSLARFCRHRCVYDCPLSDEWLAWHGQNGRAMTQGDFASFLEDHITDVVLADASAADLKDLADMLGGRWMGPNGLMTLARGLQVNVDTTVREAVTLATGEIAISYAEVHKDGAGEPIKVPNLFLITIPVFYAGIAYRIPVRLRYRVQQGRLVWSYHLYRADRVFTDAFSELCASARSATELPLFIGTPES